MHRPGWWVLACGLAALIVACATAPYTKRSQLILVSESEEMQLGADAYKEVLQKEPISHDAQAIGVVGDVGTRIAHVAQKPNYQWQFSVINDKRQANAFALPGGKVAVYTGLFPIAQDTGGLATVMGHEVAHVLAHHAAERMSQGMLFQVFGTGLAVALGSQTPATRNAIMQAFGLGAQVGVILPFSREQEAEADHIGLILMAQAGYDPHAALGLWKRFESTGKGAPPEFLSTHPSYGTREKNIDSWMPEAMGYYRPDASAAIVPLPRE
jgi:predicted Zn-dependent protease